MGKAPGDFLTIGRFYCCFAGAALDALCAALPELSAEGFAGGEAGAGFEGVSVAGTGGFGADTPATLDPSPSFCSDSASSLPVGSSPLPDWNFCIAATVFASHFPFGWP